MNKSLDRERWRRIDAILDVALDLPSDERERYVNQACGGETDLRREVEELLVASAAPDSFMSAPAVDRAAALVAGVERTRERRTSDLMAGRSVGPYRLVRELGEGGMGVVYLAERVDGQFEQRVAVKLAKQSVYSGEARRRFVQERQILARLQHASIARLLDGGVTGDGIPFFVMEHVEGRPVTTYCDEQRLGIEDRLRIFLQMCDAVQYAHRNLIVHRDLKPSNILVDDMGVVKLLDFGIAKLLDGTDSASGGSRTLVRALTPDYAAPEQVRGEPVSTSTDVYALGVLLYELLTGGRPYHLRSSALTEIERAILEEEPAAPSARTSARIRRRLRGDLDRIVLKALEKAPERRYRSADAFAADIERHLSGLPVSARGASLSYRAWKFVGRHRFGVGAAALLLLTLVAGLIATTWQARRAEREARKADAVKEFLKTLFSAADPVLAQGREPSVRQLLDAGARRIETDLRAQPDVQSEVGRVIAGVYQSLGQYDRIPPLLAADLDRRRRLDGPRSLAVAELLTQIADARYEQNQYDEAAAMYEEALAIQRERRGNRTAEVAELLWDLAGVRRNRGELAGAESMQKEALAIYVQTKGADSAETSAVRESLSITSMQRGRFADAARLMEPVVAWRDSHYGPDHPDTLNARYNLAVALVNADRAVEAKPIVEDVIARQRRVLGPRHDRLAVALRALARVLDALGQSQEALAAIEDAVSIQTEEFGTRHLQVALDQTWRAVIESHSGRLQNAERDSRAALSIFDSVTGALPAAVPPMRSQIAVVLADCGRLDEADAQLSRAVADLRTAHNDGSLLGEALDYLGDVARRRGNLERASELTRGALAILDREVGPEHRMTALARVHAGAVQWAMGHTDDGERSMRAGIAQLEKRLPGGHADLASAWLVVGDALKDGPHGSDARPLVQKAVAWRETHFGPTDPRTIEARNALRAKP